jgi:hypothetical protein
MYRVLEGKIYGVLNDFDLSYQMTDEHPNPDSTSSNQRTGTLPFMAIDLLENDPPAHCYRHDLESFSGSFSFTLVNIGTVSLLGILVHTTSGCLGIIKPFC